MHDLISRQAAIDYLVDHMTWYDADGYEVGEYEKRQNIEELINGVPSAQPEKCEDCGNFNKTMLLISQPKQRWIPCKTALPKKTGEYLVTIKWDENDYEVDCYEYNASRHEWNNGELFGGTVVAWTNKPEPWKGEAHGTPRAVLSQKPVR